MALTLDVDSQTLLLSQSSSLTIFALTDAAFSHSSQPSLNLLQFHIILIYFSLQSLKSLPFGTKISTLLSDRSLSVTILAYDPRVSLNNIPITVSPIFDDGSLIIFGIDSNLVSFNDGTVLRTNLMGFTNNITRSQDMLVLNGVSIIFSEVYHNGWFSVHGISEVLEVPHRTERLWLHFARDRRTQKNRTWASRVQI
ncbi:unnamed protein product [Prunus brigantina]